MVKFCLHKWKLKNNIGYEGGDVDYYICSKCVNEKTKVYRWYPWYFYIYCKPFIFTTIGIIIGVIIGYLISCF